MDTNEIKELNKVLLEFVGFTNIKPSTLYYDNFMANFLDNCGEISGIRSVAPNLIESLDAQAKWLYPILKEQLLRMEIGMEYDTTIDQYPHYYCEIIEGLDRLQGRAIHENPAIAFALAMKDYIEKEKINERN